MRLHHLTVSAFGPFAGTEEVDFDELNDAGLFLLAGPTGAGKSSLLDAVCFALYGTVPGARGVKALKSQHAPVDAVPEVELDFSVRGRRFVVRRTPEWTRPKKRGDGLAIERASASITELVDGEPHFLSARAAEVGHLVTEQMGMHAGQFVQVALLPQGEFQTFLRATSQERHAVLQQLFRTDRFARIEDWVHEHSRLLQTRAADGQSTVQRLLDTIAERAGTPTPEELSGDPLAQATADDRVLPWVRERLAEAESAAHEAATVHDSARAAAESARGLHDDAVRREELRARCDRARRTLRELEASEGDASAARDALDADTRAQTCRPLLVVADRAAEACASATAQREAAVTAVRSSDLPARFGLAPVEPGDAAGLAASAEQARRRLTRLEGLLPREAEARRAADERDTARAELEKAEQTRAETQARASALPGRIDDLLERRAAADERAARHAALTLALDAARERAAAAHRLPEVTARLTDLQDAHRDARDAVLDAREHVAELVDRRLAGMAAELARTLTDGSPCQVCGSTDHPDPARPAPDAVTEAAQQDAESELAALVAAADTAAAKVQAAQRERDSVATAAADLDADTADEQVNVLVEQLADSAAATRERGELDRAVEALRAEQQSLARRQVELASTVTGLQALVAERSATVASIDRQIAAELGERPTGELRTAVADLRRLVELLDRAGKACERCEQVAEQSDELAEQAARTAAEQGFDSVEAVRAALLPAEARDRLEHRLRERADAAAAAHAVLAEHATDTEAAPADLHELTLALRTATAEADAAARRRHACEERVESLRRLLERLIEAIDDWAPLRDESLRATSMSRLVRGIGADNQLQMRLSAYVLATRLDQVVAAANERLCHMRDQRYLLHRTGRAARKGSQAGLGLEVVDQWTGDVRDPATLSGGETFVVSLSLALGLADVVTQEAGGTEIETLFVDEGFGTLDADTLDDVMDRLDGLRAGGRTVGVVSHVGELRNRIPTQVLVEKTRSGSTVAVRTLVG